ncbi:uncharacterized protein CC84DRAFT_1193198 [Paraphaeosphaeria sporulosa]|uniref:Transcription factor domain-containing protein n=1 Tax=Paraphaeosphaeria sporulosa TaxID=1460663 RepID=A0A177CP81_9PLEO|nr:uncharacterized protein CC84DRAFT_1193198 [Paraphaeosphaeria sporulosa]OAG09324.1 hypothetical protein CC84DRAFT_1193198 [Paraphaeosphaeria sporulosa]
MAECARLYDAQDVFLMMHFKSTTSIDLLGDPKLWAQHALQLAFQHNFLMHAVLALAARHLQDAPQLSGGHPPYDYKIREAHHLQKTLSTFSHAFNNRIHPNQDAVLATSFLLFFHMSSIIDVNPSTTHPCEDTSFTFLRGIQAVVADGSHVAHSGRYKSLVAPPAHSPVIIPRTKASPGPVALFAHLIHNLPPLSPFLQKRETYIERFESLMPHLSASTAQDLDDEPLEELLLSLLRWQALCPSLFIDMIKAHDCIALVILAHFYAAIGFIVSQVKNRWWWFQRKPHRMVENIAEHVGPAWDIWLQWPRAVVQGYQGNTTM